MQNSAEHCEAAAAPMYVNLKAPRLGEGGGVTRALSLLSEAWALLSRCCHKLFLLFF